MGVNFAVKTTIGFVPCAMENPPSMLAKCLGFRQGVGGKANVRVSGITRICDSKTGSGEVVGRVKGNGRKKKKLQGRRKGALSRKGRKTFSFERTGRMRAPAPFVSQAKSKTKEEAG
jgi:hypothetical protein